MAFLLWCLILVPLQLLLMLFTRDRAAYFLPYIWHNVVCRIFSLKIEVCGEPETKHQTIFVCNHISYLDIPVLACILRCSFVAKKEVASWPLFGLLAKLQQTYFIDRSRSAVVKGKEDLARRLAGGKSLIIFPEGTSSPGHTALPFKSSLFSILLAGQASPRKEPHTEQIRDLYAWHGDMTLLPHLWAFAKSRGAKIRLYFHEPIRVKGEDNRKTLASKCHSTVIKELEDQTMIAA
jgi:1-acyl-sn-glycerol-3-phosphate acyltransferase